MVKVDRRSDLRDEESEPLKKKGQKLIPVIRTMFSVFLDEVARELCKTGVDFRRIWLLRL